MYVCHIFYICTQVRVHRLDGLGIGSRCRPDRLCHGYVVFPGVKRPEHGADHPSPSSAGFRMDWSYKSTSPLCLHGRVMGLLSTLYARTATCVCNHTSYQNVLQNSTEAQTTSQL